MARAAAPMLRGLRAATRTTRKRSNSAQTGKNTDFTTRTGRAFFRMAIEQIAFSFLWSTREFLCVRQQRRRTDSGARLTKSNFIWGYHSQVTETEVAHGASGCANVERVARSH